MNKIATLIIIAICLSSQLIGQVRYPTGRINVNTNPGGIAEEVKAPIEFTKEELYVIDEWSRGFIYLKSGTTLKSDSVRYNIIDNQLEIAKEGAVKVLTPKMLNSFELITPVDQKRYFVNSESFKYNASMSPTFFEVLNEGDVNLLKFHDYERLAPNYNPALDVGSRTAKLSKKSRYFIAQNYVLHEVPNRKRDFLSLFDEQQGSAIKDYMSDNKLNHRKPDELLKILEFVNQ